MNAVWLLTSAPCESSLIPTKKILFVGSVNVSVLGPFVPINRCSRHFRDHQGSGITEDSVWRVGLRQLPVPLVFWCENRVLKWFDTWPYLETSLVAWFVHPSCCAVDTSKCSYGLDLCLSWENRRRWCGAGWRY